MAFESLWQRFNGNKLPLILAGPILRRTQKDSVTVWVALRKPQRVTLRVFDTADKEWAIGTVKTLRVFQHLHITAVTASPTDTTKLLQAGQNYFYDLNFGDLPTNPGDPIEHVKREVKTGLRGKGIFSAPDQDAPPLGFVTGSTDLPSFSLPPTDLKDLHILQGSCRKAGGDSIDALAAAHTILRQTASDANKRPHQLFLTGDQIYGDAVPDTLLYFIKDASVVLIKGEESDLKKIFEPDTKLDEEVFPGLPVTKEQHDALGTGLDESELNTSGDYVQGLGPGLRQDWVAEFCGFTSGAAKSHLLSFDEYALAYLFYWSPVLWPEDDTKWPAAMQDVIRGVHPPTAVRIPGKSVPLSGPTLTVMPDGHRDFVEQQTHSRIFLKTLAAVRLVLANIPTYMIFDDHEVTDDWNLNRSWIKRVFRSAVGRQIIRNAITAYGLFQAWGNVVVDEDENQDPTRIRALLNTFSEWSGGSKTFELSAFKPSAPFPAHQRLMYMAGLPASDTDVQRYLGELDTDKQLPRSSVPPVPPIPTAPPWVAESPNWHYSLDFETYEVRALDLRTWRTYPDLIGMDKLAPELHFCGLLSEQGLKAQIGELPPGASNKDKLLILISPAPLVGLPMNETLQEKSVGLPAILDTFWDILWSGPYSPPWGGHGDRSLTKEATEYADPEAWPLARQEYELFLAHLVKLDYRRALIFSGDVHYSLIARLQYWNEGIPYHPSRSGPTDPNDNARFGRHLVIGSLTSSSLRNQHDTPLAKGESVNHLFGGEKVHEPVEKLGWNGQGPAFDIGEYTTVISRQWTVPDDPPFVVYFASHKSKQPTKIDDQTPPDWRYRIDYLQGKETNRTSPTPGSKVEDADFNANKPKGYQDTCVNHRDSVYLHGISRGIIWQSNLAQVLFKKKWDIEQLMWWTPEDVTLTNADPALLQPFTRYVIRLCNDEAAYPRPRADEDSDFSADPGDRLEPCSSNPVGPS